ncbi:MAG: VPS10 domain-containing protein, partial [Vicinamibacterales bacterium]
MRTTPRSLALVVIALLVAAAVPAPVATQADSNVIVHQSLYQDLKWRSVGPHRGGRVTAISGVRQQPCTFYMGATGGGVWKTETCGNIWTPVSDGQIATGSIGSIDVSESNPDIVYVGTGSAAIRSNIIIGRGVYKSTDAGKTWQFLGLKESGQIGEVRVHPSNPDVVWLAALGSPFGPNAERGIFKTTDGGKTWRKTLFIDNEHGGRTVAVDKSNPNVLYAAIYRGFRKGWDIISGGPADKGGIYKSTDAGETWTRLSSGLPRTLIGKIDIDIARSNPRVVYAMVEAPREEGGLYRSDDAGATWRIVNNSPSLRFRPFYFHYVDVNPRDENEVWVNELRLHRSNDGGKTFTQVPTPHGDNHGMWFNPDNPDIILQCNDGGANVSVDHGRSWSSILNQPHAELYMVQVDSQTPYRLYAPQQDNSTIVVDSVPRVAWGYDHASMSWTQASGCETGQIAPTPDGRIIWGVCKGEIGRYNTETGQEQHYWIYPQNRYGHDPDDIRERFPRQSIVYLSPHDPTTVYHASHRVFRTTDDGLTWTRISDDLTAREPQYQIIPGNPITRDITGEEVYSSLYAFAEARNEKGVLWAGANDGPVHVSRDAGRTWTNVTPKDLVGARIQNIEDSPHRKGSAYIAGYRFLREHDLHPYVYLTNDYGRTWTKLTDGKNGIPADHPVRVVREDPEREGLLYAGTEFGFFVSFNNGKNWQPLQQNLPATPVTDIRVHRGDLVVATMGRSFWIMDDVTPLRQAGARDMTMTAARGTIPAAELSQPRTRPRFRYDTVGGVAGARPGDFSVPQYPPVSLAIDYYLPSSAPADLKLEITDAGGRTVRTVQPAGAPGAAQQTQAMRGPRRGGGGATVLTTKAGHNRFLWDYRWATEGGMPPMVAPGQYTAKLTAGGAEKVVTFSVEVDPRVMKDNVTVPDLVEQQNFLLKVNAAIADARRLSTRMEQTLTKAGLKTPAAPGAGEDVSLVTYQHPAQRIWARLVDAAAPYPKPVLINQFQNIVRMLNQADQKVGKDAYERFADLEKELAALK